MKRIEIEKIHNFISEQTPGFIFITADVLEIAGYDDTIARRKRVLSVLNKLVDHGTLKKLGDPQARKWLIVDPGNLPKIIEKRGGPRPGTHKRYNKAQRAKTVRFYVRLQPETIRRMRLLKEEGFAPTLGEVISKAVESVEIARQ